ncbi:MAG: hypothetical protein P1P90_06480 [Patescibacteria group bacterium]|nr:hypothetical protein [Patescibacteria group bacterium]
MENSQKLLDKIQKENIEQRKKSEFAAKNIFFWTMFTLSVLIGGLATSVLIFAFGQTEFDLLSHITHSRVELFLGMLPIVWIFFSFVFLAASIALLRKTKKGYKYSPVLVLMGNLIMSLILGTVIYFSGGAVKIESIFAKNVPGYQSVEEKKTAIWSAPEDGFLSGTIISVENEVILQDWNGKDWKIDTKDALIRGRVSMRIGEEVKIIGEMSSEGLFKASEIRPWKGQGNGANHVNN